MRNAHLRFMGCLGFLGFQGFEYFQTHSITSLSYFAFFGFFSYFWISRIANEMVDERYIENERNAKAFTFNIALIEFAVLFLISPLHFVSREIVTILSALCFSSLLICYAIAFYKYEKI